MRVKTGLAIEIGKHRIPVVVTSEGVFWCEWEGSSYNSTTFKGLRVKLLPKVREDAKRCDLAAMLRNYGDDFERIALIGIHADNGNVLYTDSDGKTHQLSRRDKRVFRVLTNAELHQHATLIGNIEREKARLNAWLKVRYIEPGKTVRAAIGLPPEPKRDERIDDDDDLT